MSVRFIDCDQNSPAWEEARRGIATASSFKDILAQAKNGSDREMRDTYMRKLAGEIITKRPAENYTNDDMMRGHEQEADAVAHYAFLRDVEPLKVGFARNDEIRAGASPDRLVGDDGLLEIKTKAPHVMADLILKWDGTPPNEFKAQLQGQLWITGRQWVDIAFFCPGMAMPIARVDRDEFYIATLAAEIRQFNAELDAMVDRLNAFGQPTALAA